MFDESSSISRMSSTGLCVAKKTACRGWVSSTSGEPAGIINCSTEDSG